MLPYTADILFSAHERFLGVWGWLTALIAASAVTGAILSQRGRDPGGRVLGASVAAGWAWVGGGFFLGPMATLDFSAPFYGIAFLVQAAILVWAGPVRGRLGIRIRMQPRVLVGAVLIGAGAVIYPLADGLIQSDWLGLRPVFAAPGSTALVTLGLFLAVRERPPIAPAVLPSLWCAVAAGSGWALGIPSDVALLAPALAAFALLIAVRRSC